MRLEDNPNLLREMARREGRESPELADISKVDFKSCDLCSHLLVCDMAKHVAGMIAGQYPEDKAPVKYQDLAKICSMFQLKTSMKTKELAKE